MCINILIEYFDLPFGLGDKSREDIYQCRLPCAILSEECDEPSEWDRKIDCIECFESARIDFRESRDFECEFLFHIRRSI